MRVTLLGTGSPIPDPRRAGPSTLVHAGGLQILVDCGRGVLMRLAAANSLPPLLHAVFITHLHSDHITDLGDVITTRWIMSPGRNPLDVYGPPGTAEVVAATLASLAPDIRYRIDHHGDLHEGPAVTAHEVVAGERFTVGPNAEATVIVAATDHRPVEPTVAFRIEAEGRAVVLGGDGVPCEGLDSLCKGADAYVQTVLRDDLVRLVPMPRFQDILDYHSTVAQAAQTAHRNGVGTLVLTHYVPTIAPGQEDDWRALAAEHFTGNIVLGDDLTTVEF